MNEPILIVDDNPVNLKLISFVIRQEGLACRTATSAEQALELLTDWCPDLILLDIQLPGMSGLDFTRLLRSQPDKAGIVIIAVTASAMKDDEAAAMEAGVNGYLLKPIDTRSLPGFIRLYLK
jgi:CheY-like chemotaxis protein